VHELSLVQGLLSQLQRLAAEHGAARVISVRVSIGTGSGIVVDSFVFGFDAVKTESELTCSAVLDIEEVDGNDLVLMQVEMEGND
jgi:Zn finger protein HypA/HybF involved in hydrogenase expression